MSQPAAGPAISVVIPAFNEAAVIGRCLSSLLSVAAPGELDIVVVCNGCTDRTADIARAFGAAVRVLETPTGSKPLALNLGDRAALTFPRVYMDADVELSTEAVRAVAEPLICGEVQAAAPRLELDTSATTWAVRAYHRVWAQTPQVANGLMGRGVYALSAQGRARFGAFPNLIADDLFIDELFPPHQRRVLVGCTSRVRAPATLRDLLHRKIRVFAGKQQLHADRPTQAPTQRLRHLVTLLRSNPSLAPSAAIYLTLNAEAKRRARRADAPGHSRAWERDESSRLKVTPTSVHTGNH